MMKTAMKTTTLWFLALFVTLVAAHYQRMTGPTYPLSGKSQWGGTGIRYSLERSHSGSDDHRVRVTTLEPSIQGEVIWKRFKTEDPWRTVPMTYQNGILVGELPGQPPAGKLEYRVKLFREGTALFLPTEGSAIIRFKGEVPLGALIPHIVFMFAAMLLCARTGFEALRTEPVLMKRLSVWTFSALLLGGMILGPVVQKYAFGAYWTGWPYGTDLTDNKTLIAFVAWGVGLIAVFRARRLSQARFWVLGAVLVMFVVFLIPHSMRGSELDYNKLDAGKRDVSAQ